MAARPLARAVARHVSQSASAVSRRSFIAAASSRPTLVAASRAAIASPVTQQIRGVKTIDFAGTKETVYGEFVPRHNCVRFMSELLANETLEREDWPREKLLVSQRCLCWG